MALFTDGFIGYGLEYCRMKEFALIITLIMPGDQPDVRHLEPAPSIEACFVAAKKFLAKPLTEDMKAHGVIGVAAACAWREEPKKGDPA
jgi:hypothetical protein